MGAEENPPPETEAILTAENLNAAWAQVKANAGAAGAEGRTLARTAEPIKRIVRNSCLDCARVATGPKLSKRWTSRKRTAAPGVRVSRQCRIG